ncbi:MAG: FtsX-like permease family protein [Lachnospiraceae bacterium]|nr:FtsX-like permease family protein [Lachnospiraceae bacterium]
MQYIINKKREITISVLSLLFWIINLIFAEMSINMLLKVLTAKRTDWFDNMKKVQITEDAFLIKQTELVMETIIIVMFVIFFFSSLTIILVRNLQLKHNLSEIGMFRVLGYNKNRLLGICMIDVITDMVIALPVSVVLSTVIWNKLSKDEMLSFMLTMINDTIWMDILSYVLCAITMMLVAIIHTKFFLERSLKKGVRYMLGEGVA